MQDIERAISFLGKELVNEIIQSSQVIDVPKGTLILKEGQYVKSLPIVIDGLIKVYTEFNERELLLYYIQDKESCIMSFSASRMNDPSKVFAITEQDSKILLLPVEKLPEWVKKYPSINELFYSQFNQRYIELLDTINHVIFDKMDKRLYNHLKEKARLRNQNPLQITHKQIANELGTVREVISRVMKKLESEGKVKQEPNKIKIL